MIKSTRVGNPTFSSLFLFRFFAIIAFGGLSQYSHSQSSTLDQLNDEFGPWQTKIAYASVIRAVGTQIGDQAFVDLGKKLDFIAFWQGSDEDRNEEIFESLESLWDKEGKEMAMSMSSGGMDITIYSDDVDGLINEMVILANEGSDAKLILIKGSFTFGDLPFNAVNPFGGNSDPDNNPFAIFDNLIDW